MIRRAIGIAVLAGGLLLCYLAYQGSQTFGDETKHLFTGEYRERTYWLFGAGAVLIVAAAIGLVVPMRRRPLLS